MLSQCGTHMHADTHSKNLCIETVPQTFELFLLYQIHIQLSAVFTQTDYIGAYFETIRICIYFFGPIFRRSKPTCVCVCGCVTAVFVLKIAMLKPLTHTCVTSKFNMYL